MFILKGEFQILILVFITMVHSLSLPCFEHVSSSNFCFSFADFQGKFDEPTMNNLVESDTCVFEPRLCDKVQLNFVILQVISKGLFPAEIHEFSCLFQPIEYDFQEYTFHRYENPSTFRTACTRFGSNKP